MSRTKAALLALACLLLALVPAAASAQQRIFTVAGSGPSFDSAPGAFGGDSGPATDASLSLPSDLALARGGGYLIADSLNSRVRFVSPRGVITTVAGTGRTGFGGDGGPATAATFSTISGVAATPDGGFLVADAADHSIRRVDSEGIIRTVAGTGRRGFSGDDGPATSARLNTPTRMAALRDGGFLFTDTVNHRIRRVDPAGTISTVAGSGAPGVGRGGFAGDGDPATLARLNTPSGLAATSSGGILIADSLNHRIRLVNAGGSITTIAGSGPSGIKRKPRRVGDGGSALEAQLYAPDDVALAVDGSVIVNDALNARVRRVNLSGIISTIAGTGRLGYGGDGRPARRARIASAGLEATPDGGVLISNLIGNRVRFVEPVATERLALALYPIRRVGPSFKVAYVTTVDAALRLDVFRGKRRVERATAQAGKRLIVRRLPPGRYRLRLTARTANGQVATGETRVRLTPQRKASSAQAAGTSSNEVIPLNSP